MIIFENQHFFGNDTEYKKGRKKKDKLTMTKCQPLHHLCTVQDSELRIYPLNTFKKNHLASFDFSLMTDISVGCRPQGTLNRLHPMSSSNVCDILGQRVDRLLFHHHPNHHHLRHKTFTTFLHLTLITQSMPLSLVHQWFCNSTQSGLYALSGWGLNAKECGASIHL